MATDGDASSSVETQYFDGRFRDTRARAYERSTVPHRLLSPTPMITSLQLPGAIFDDCCAYASRASFAGRAAVCGQVKSFRRFPHQLRRHIGLPERVVCFCFYYTILTL